MIICDYIWLYMIICDYIWLYMIIYDHIWLYMIIYDYIWLCMIIYNCIWLYNYIWLYILIYLSLCLCLCVCAPCQHGAWHGMSHWYASRISKPVLMQKLPKASKSHCGKPMPHVCKHNCKEETQLSSKAVRLLLPRYVCMQPHHMWYAMLRRTFLISSSVTAFWSRRK